MWGITYRGCHILGYCDKSVVTVVLPDHSYLRGWQGFTSLRSAKRAIRAVVL